MSERRRTQPAPTPAPAPRGPEKKFGPFAGGIGVAVWLNSVQGDDGATRRVRSITLSPRRYRDRQTGEWRDSTSYYPGDIPALMLALQLAQEFIITTPIPGEEPEPGHDAHEGQPY